MCGIIGLYTNNPRYQKNKEFVVQALYAGALRGMHGTGVACVHTNKNIHIFKRAVPSYDLLDMRGFSGVVDKMHAYRAVIGHNRHKTMGDQVNSHTHPFNHGKITLVHNGSLTHMGSLPGNSPVDSERITLALDAHPPEDVIPKLEGAFALVWWNADEQALYIVRNDERPLFIGKDKDHDTIYFASEPRMLSWITGRVGVNLEDIYQPVPGELLKYTNGDCVPEKKQLEVHKRVYYQDTHRGYRDHGRGSSQQLRTIDSYQRAKFLDANGLHVGKAVVLAPVAWVGYTAGEPTDKSHGRLFLQSDDHDCTFVWSACKYKELATDHFHTANVCGVAMEGGKVCALVNNVRKAGKNDCHLSNADVYQFDRTGVLDERKLRHRMLLLSTSGAKATVDGVDSDENASCELVVGPEGKFMEVSEYSRLIRGGCCMCGSPLDIKDAPHTFDKSLNVYCDDCCDPDTSLWSVN